VDADEGGEHEEKEENAELLMDTHDGDTDDGIDLDDDDATPKKAPASPEKVLI